MRFRPIEHLENRKMHTQERQLTRFCILQLIYKENWTDGFSKPNWNRNRTEPAVFLKTEIRMELEKSIPHIPSIIVVLLPGLYCLLPQ